LVNLLNYAAEMLKMGDKAILDVAKDAIFALYEHDLLPLEGCTIPQHSGDWLRFARLQPIPPPTPAPLFEEWLRDSNRPFDAPRLRDTAVISVTLEYASELIEAALAEPDDVLAGLKTRAGSGLGAEAESSRVDIQLSLERMPEFAAAFATWVAESWQPWAATEQPRRRSIAVYNRLFETQQRIVSMGEDAPVEVVLGIGLARWAHERGKLNAPLIEASVELALDEETGAITVQYRQVAPSLMLRAFDELEVEGVGKLSRNAGDELERLFKDPDIGFSPHTPASFESVLRMCAARLTGTALYMPDAPGGDAERLLPVADATLRITSTWVLYVRQRSSHIIRDDIKRLIERIREAVEAADLPQAAVQIATRPLAEKSDDPMIDLGDNTLPDAPLIVGPAQLSASAIRGAPSGANEDPRRPIYFFPLPYNDEQVQIVRLLEKPDTNGVVVQGPPGTGKTHTIANIIAHYMATGRRVLVSARSPEALSAIHDKLPVLIRELVISVIHSDREGARRLEAAVRILGDQVKQIDVRAYDQQRRDLEQQLAMVRQDLERTDHDIADYAERNLAAVPFRGETLIPMELAQRLEQEARAHQWFIDAVDLAPRFEAQFQDTDIAEAGRLRAQLGEDIVYIGAELPGPNDLPEPGQIVAAHGYLARESENEARAAAGDFLYVSFGSGLQIDDARDLHAWVVELGEWEEMAQQTADWLLELYGVLMGAVRREWAARDGLRSLCQAWTALQTEGQPFLLRAIELPGVTLQDAEFDQDVAAQAQGRKPFGLFASGKSSRKAKLAGVRLDGVPPTTPEHWAYIRDFRSWQQKTTAFAANWSQSAEMLGWPKLSEEWQALRRELLRLGPLVQQAHVLHQRAERAAKLLAALFPTGVVIEDVVVRRQTSAVRESLSVALATEGRLAAEAVRETMRRWSTQRLALHQAIAEMLDMLGKSDVAPREIGENWKEILREAARLNGQRAMRERLKAIAIQVEMSGAPRWAAALTGEPAQGPDRWCRPDWRRSWEWARAAGFMRTISDRRVQSVLSNRRRELEDKQRALMSEIVRLRTFIGLKQRITNPIASALAMFAMKVAQLGAGTGKSAERHRRAIREATLQAADAVPCWVLPEWRVAEQLPSELAQFDLVIIDEASQSDITALPVVLRGKKLLVVGDDKQVSPSAVAFEDRAIVQLRQTYLMGMHLANSLEPTTSLYDLAAVTLPGTVTMLREHFRCVEPIIRFSSRFYGHSLVPLRVPTAEERLEPPLVDIYVPHGRRVHDRNPAEADVIVEEIAALVADPTYARRSIGVISLIGDKQAKLIWDRLTARIGADGIQRHRIMCGNASTFQGQERDIMFLSMVACPQTARTQVTRSTEQRFNVAMSRARDRVYLVRSVAAAMLSHNDMKLAVIEHFRDPMGGVIRPQPQDVLDNTDSEFERDFGRHLLGLGYQLRPQVPVGDYRIDFVIEGDGDRRLAVELDGDRYHGPERWAHDHHRQRALERIGWTFWRCWGSHWLADRQACLDDLLGLLDRLAIRPRAGGFTDQVWTEHRVVDSPTGPSHGRREAADTVSAAPAASAGPPGVEAPATLPSLDVQGDLVVAEPALTERRGETLVEPGDTVIVRYGDDVRVRRFRLSVAEDKPDLGIVRVTSPIGQALLGNAVDDEVDLVVDGQTKRIVIEKITKAAPLEAFVDA